jgi:hypothetical protein
MGMIRILQVLCLLQVCIQLRAQFSEDFNNINSLTSPAWQGNVSHFIVNASRQLQLNAPAAGDSYVYTKYKIPQDSIMVDLFFRMNFDPSDNNQTKIYLFMDRPEENLANGYYLRLGENGNNDAIRVIRLINGVSTVIASGSMGDISRDPAQARLQLLIRPDGYWELFTDYNGGFLLNEDMAFNENTIALPDSVYFGIFCRYSSTRLSHFIFDDIVIKNIENDTVAPTALLAEVLDENTLRLGFSEIPDETSVKMTQNYTVNNGLGNPVEISINSATPNFAELRFTEKIRSGLIYTINIQGVKDRAGNITNQALQFTYAVPPVKGDIFLTEVLTDPYSGGEDFIEIYNASDKFIQLRGLTIRNEGRNENRTITENYVLLPEKYVALSDNIDFLSERYQPDPSAQLLKFRLPALNVSDAFIKIIPGGASGSVAIDSFEYNQKMHFSLIDNTKGVSLEKINIKGPSNDSNNWHSAAEQFRFATPGYRNSNRFVAAPVGEEMVELGSKTFSPDGDGYEDVLLIQFFTDKPGYLTTVKIFDAEGFPVRDLANNFLLGTDSTLKWDGVDNEGKASRTGMYIIRTRLFHPDGQTFNVSKVAVLASGL